jgi:hypothetical protein
MSSTHRFGHRFGRFSAVAWLSPLLLSSLLSLSVMGCLPPKSRIAHGQMYAAGKEPYNAYFRDVHAAQVAASSWSDEKKTSRKPLVTVLELTPDAPDVTLVQAANERAARYAPKSGALRLEVTGTDAKVVGATEGEGGDLFQAVEQTARAELDRAKRMHAEEPKLDELAKTGHELESRVQDDFGKYGSMKVKEVQVEMSASFDALGKLDTQAKRQAREAEDFVSDLQRAIEAAATGKKTPRAGDAPPAKTDKTDKTEKPKPPPGPRPPPPPKPEGTPPAPKPAPAPPPPKPADTGEVFAP